METQQLSDEQKALLRLVANGIRNRRKNDEPWWIRMAHAHSMPVWQAVSSQRVWCELQQKTNLGAMMTFENLGFIQRVQPERYALVEPRILEAGEKGLY